MPANWSAPRTWSVGELVTAALLNTHLRDNLEFLKTPPTGLYTLNQGGDYSITSTTFVDVDATNLALTITTAGGDVLIGFSGSFAQATSLAYIYLDLLIDGVRFMGDDGIIFHQAATANARFHMSFCVLKQGLAVGSHTFKLQWRVSAGAGTLYAGAGTAGLDNHAQFWVREV